MITSMLVGLVGGAIGSRLGWSLPRTLLLIGSVALALRWLGCP